MTRSIRVRLLAATALLLCSPLLPPAVQAQIASPVNAGQNSGNNAFGSARTTIGTPDFTQGRTVVLVPGVRLQRDGTLLARPDQQAAVQTALLAWLRSPEGAGLAALLSDRAASLDPQWVNQLSAGGVDPANARALITALAGLANQTSLNQLASAIQLFNGIVSTPSTPLLIAIRQALASARSAL